MQNHCCSFDNPADRFVEKLDCLEDVDAGLAEEAATERTAVSAAEQSAVEKAGAEMEAEIEAAQVAAAAKAAATMPGGQTAHEEAVEGDQEDLEGQDAAFDHNAFDAEWEAAMAACLDTA